MRATIRTGAAIGLIAAVAVLATTTNAFAQKQMTKLGNPATRVTAPIKDAAALQKAFANKRTQALIQTVMDKAGLAALTPKVIEALTEGKFTTTTVAPGTTIRWMALRRGGKADIILDAVWAGKTGFDGFAFTIEDGVNIYSFVVPKACGNLALLTSSERPLPGCVNVAVARNCDRKEATFSATGAAISGDQVTKVTVLRDGSNVGEMLPGGGFKLTLPIQPGRYTFMATDKYGRQFGTCERELTLEACVVAAPPPPPPPPAPTSCGATLTALPAKGGWNLNVDSSASGAGASPAAKAVVKLIGPDGNPVAFSYGGKSQTEVELKAPFQAATFFVPKAKPGTYTVRGLATPSNPKAEPRSCEATVVVPAEDDNLDWFTDGAFGKQRRQYELAAKAPLTTTVEPGFCDPMLGFKAGPLFWFNGQRASFAPAAGVAMMFGDLGDYDYGDNNYNNVSVFLEAVVNYHFSPRGAYVGGGIGWWDVFDGDHNTGAWVVNFGVPISSNAKGNQMHFIGEGRIFMTSPDGMSNNYQMWGGIRYIWK